MFESESAEALHSEDDGDGHRDEREIVRRFATKQDVADWYGDVPWTIRAIVVCADGLPIAMCGLAREQTRRRIFFDIDEDEDADQYKIKRTILDVMKWVRRSRLEVYGLAEHETGAKLMKRLGFNETEEGMYIWPNF